MSLSDRLMSIPEPGSQDPTDVDDHLRCAADQFTVITDDLAVGLLRRVRETGGTGWLRDRGCTALAGELDQHWLVRGGAAAGAGRADRGPSISVL